MADTRLVIFKGHVPFGILPEGATAEQAQQKCDELTAAHKGKPRSGPAYAWGRYEFCTVPVLELEPGEAEQE